jgi:hypothetical protein
LADATYFERLAQCVLNALNEDQQALRTAIIELLANSDKRSPSEVPIDLESTSRDQLQDAIAKALLPSPDLETQHRPRAIQNILNFVAWLPRLPNAGWHDSVALLQKRSGRKLPRPIKSKEEWVAFLMEGAPGHVTLSSESKKAQGIETRRFLETAMLVRSFAPVVARRAAANLKKEGQVRKIFKIYGFTAYMEKEDQQAQQNRLASCLNGSKRPDGKSAGEFMKWPAATLAGSFAAALATVVEYSPSAWVLERELQSIDNSRATRATPEKKTEAGDADKTAKEGDGGNANKGGPGNPSDRPREDAWGAELLGLCFSGGGIRSATFNLGVLQGLAKLGMLHCFDYLSTVSGGGYISSWLVSWIKRDGIKEVNTHLSPGLVADPADPRLRPIEFLRQFSNYLTPRTGLLSVDTWVLAIVWLRNTLLNLAVLLPALLGLLFLPRFLEVWASQAAPQRFLFSLTGPWLQRLVPCAPPGFPAWLLGIQIFFICGICVLIGANLRKFSCGKGDVADDDSDPGFPPWYTRPWWIRNLIVMPVFPAAWIIALKLRDSAGLLGMWDGVAIASIAAALAYSTLWIADYPACFRETSASDGKVSYLGAAAMCGIACAIGIATLLFALGLDSIFSPWHGTEAGADAVTVWGPPLVVLALFLLTVLLVGLMGRNLPRSGAMWLGRLMTHMAMYAVVWLVWMGIALYGASLTNHLWTWGHTWAKWPVIAAWVWTTLKSVLASNDPHTSAPNPGGWKTQLGFYTTVGPFVFIIGLMLALSYVAEKEFVALGFWICSWNVAFARAHPWMFAAVVGFGASFVLAGILSVCVDVNEFSMNTFYRSRLVRCYLGATRKFRRPSPFIGFDPRDDKNPLAVFKNDGADLAYDGPYPLYNATLNLVHGEELAWQERKGASFVFTPDQCGYETPWNATTNPPAFRNLEYLSYRDTKEYAYHPDGMHLGTPVSISGAALSPNMGFYSSPATAFLMTLFNVRLGWWLGNPRHKELWKKAGPTQGLAYLVKELLGLTDDRAGFVYLSDGGHFENLGIYELVRRRCRYIIACDAEEDAGLNFHGLGNAVRKCRQDFGVEINIRPDRIKLDPATGHSRTHCVVGTIQYPDQPGLGYLVYLKSSLVGDEPADVLEYHAKHPAFPHESTGDQWFTESQFESYRRLGLHIATTAFLRAAENVPAFFEEKGIFFHEVMDRWYAPSDALEKNFTRHASAYDALVREMRSDEMLRTLDPAMYPQPGDPPVAWPAKKEDKEKVFLFVVSLLQVMENVYLDLDLENTADHPVNAGWIEIFRMWARSDVFKDAWQRSAWTYGRNFQSFCNHLFGLTDNNH